MRTIQSRKDENLVKAAKQILKKALADERNPHLALLAWRKTPTEDLPMEDVQETFTQPRKAIETETTHRSKNKKKPNGEGKNGAVIKEVNPNSTQKTWRKKVCHKTVVARLYELISKQKAETLQHQQKKS